MKKRLFCLLIAVLLGMMLSVGCLAETPAARFQIQNVITHMDNSLSAVLYSTIEPTVQNLSAAVDKNIVGIKSVLHYTQKNPIPTILIPGLPLPAATLAPSSGTGTTWLFLIDTSTVSTNKGSEPIRALIASLVDMIGINDNAALIAAGTDLSGVTLTSDKEQLRNAEFYASQTASLNDTIADALTYLNTNPQTRPHTCLVIVSKGSSFKADDALPLAESHTTIYPVAIEVSDQPVKDTVTQYLALANKSLGGISVQKHLPSSSSSEERNQAVAEIIASISANEHLFYTVSLGSVSNLPMCQELSLRMNLPGLSTFQFFFDTISLSSARRN